MYREMTKLGKVNKYMGWNEMIVIYFTLVFS